MHAQQSNENKKQTTTNTYICAFNNKKQKQLEEQHISATNPNYVALPVNHMIIIHSSFNEKLFCIRLLHV